MDDRSKVISLLKERGYRVTPQRLEIIGLILEKLDRKQHPTFNEIFNSVRSHTPTISVSTVYNTLKLLEEIGLVVSFEYKGETFYDKVEKHINIVCLDKGQVADADPRISEKVIKSLMEEGIEPLNIVVYTRCTRDVLNSNLPDR